ncbi:MAG: SDR family oxidoreductase [Pseudomonadota bacterium]
MASKTRSAVVTGVSSGIGRAIAQTLIGDGWRVFGSVRKEEDAEELKSSLGGAFIPLLFDVTDPDAIESAAQKVRAELDGQTLAGLVNNAGVTVSGPLLYIDPDEVRRQLEINLFGALHVTQAFAPMLGADASLKGKPGRIVNMSSAAGKIGWPIQGPYSMSKHALEAFSASLRRELMVHGIDVVIVGPGAVKTAIWDKGGETDPAKYRDTEYYDVMTGLDEKYAELAKDGLEPEAIGDLVRDILDGRKTKTRYAVMNNKFIMWTLPMLLPPRWFDRILFKQFGFRKVKKQR